MKIIFLILSYLAFAIANHALSPDEFYQKIPTITTKDFSDAIKTYPELLTIPNNQQRTLLFMTTMFRRQDLVGELLKNPQCLASEIINGRDGLTGWSALHYAAFYNLVGIAEALLKTSAINIHLPTDDSAQNTALHLAGKNRAKEVFKLLMEHGANLTTINALNEKAKPLM